MNVEKFDFTGTGLFSSLFTDYINKNEELRPFYSQYPDLKGFKNQIESKQFPTEIRAQLHDVLSGQYNQVEAADQVLANISLIQDTKTFTITTGHQLNIFTGPLYFIYKIVTVINTCRELKKNFPDYNFVPVYWMASEDHDFEEISYFNLFGEKYTWETDQKGAVGRMDPHSLEAILKQMPGTNELFKKAYLEHHTLSEAVRYYVNALFGDEGLVVIDADNRDLKNIFRPVIRDELVNNSSFLQVNKQTELLENKGFKGQINPREINLFYLDEDLRERIIKEGNDFKVLGTELKFNEEQILQMVDESPEKFSPNVILRPLYQEMILPNLAYVGGPAEIVYWLQLKSVFDQYGVRFPILLPRNFVLYIDHIAARKMEKTGAEVSDVFLGGQEIVQKLVSKISDNEINLDKEMMTFSDLFNGINKQVTNVDITLDKLVNAEARRMEKSLQKIEKKVSKALLRQHDDLTQQITSWHSMLYPNGNMQERTSNFLNFFLDDDQFISKIKDHLDPLDLRYHVLTEKE